MNSSINSRNTIPTIETMVTTVQVTNSTKRELLLIKAQLELHSGQKHTLDDAIQWLVERSKNSSTKDGLEKKKSCLGAIRDLPITLTNLTKLRQERNSRVADF